MILKPSKRELLVWGSVFDLREKKKRLKALKKSLQSSDVWGDLSEQKKLLQEVSELADIIDNLGSAQKEARDLEEISELSGEDLRLQEDIREHFQRLSAKVSNLEFKIFLNGPYDKNGAILIIQTGAGGKDAQDWTAMLLRMYVRFCEAKGFKVKILSQTFGDAKVEDRINIKEAVIEIKGKWAYGTLKNEQGVHRLVRISPFSSQKLRHTSFALIEVIPIIPGIKKEVKIRPEDLKIETFRASGPGGQYVNKKETAVRIVHIPTGIAVTCQSERSQGMNREKAMDTLLAKLYQREIQKEEEKIEKTRGKRVTPTWGHQIRSYILHPYKLVKDHRTNVETNEVEKVLDGQLDKFIEAEILNQKIKVAQP